MQIPRILNYGSLNIDHTFRVDHIVLPGQTISSTALSSSAGGKGANQSAALAKAGSVVFHAGKVGKDGLCIIDLLSGYGVDTRFIRVTEHPSGQAIIQLDRESQNSIILYPGSNIEITKEEIDETLHFFHAGDYLVLQNEICHTAYLIEQAKKKDMRICFNPAPFKDEIFDLPLQELDILVVNELEGKELSRSSQISSDDHSFRKLLDKLCTMMPHTQIILTVGNLGSYYGFQSKRLWQDIYQVPVVDTTAAGDTFVGYFLSAKIRGLSDEICLQKASLAASITVSRSGAMISIPTAEEVW